jgi:hypothetical protein
VSVDRSPVPREVVLVTGISGSGKSVALNALEDAGYFCVDNLPPELLRQFLELEHERAVQRMAIAVDVRTTGSLPFLLPLIDDLRAEGWSMPRPTRWCAGFQRHAGRIRCRPPGSKAMRLGGRWSMRSGSNATCSKACASAPP